jgi:hypothetical protein
MGVHEGASPKVASPQAKGGLGGLGRSSAMRGYPSQVPRTVTSLRQPTRALGSLAADAPGALRRSNYCTTQQVLYASATALVKLAGYGTLPRLLKHVWLQDTFA